VSLQTTTRKASVGALLLATVAAFPAATQTIKMTAAPTPLYVDQDLTYTITVESTRKLIAEVQDILPDGVQFVSVQHSGPAANRCAEKTGYVPLIGSLPTVVSYRTYVTCLVQFPGTESITIIVSPTQPGLLTDTATLSWVATALPRRIDTAKASAGAFVVALTPIFANYGPAAGSLCPPGSQGFTEANCINQGGIGVNGDQQTFFSQPLPEETVAASFTPLSNFTLSDIQIPFGIEPILGGTNSFNLWITADNGGVPGAVLEAIPSVSFPSHGLPVWTTVTTIKSKLHPTLSAGTQYWLVIGPGAADTFGLWNWAWNDFATSSNYLVNLTNALGTVPSGQWVPGNSTQLDLLRTAFEIRGVPQP
jgi:hypothetical protein